MNLFSSYVVEELLPYRTFDMYWAASEFVSALPIKAILNIFTRFWSNTMSWIPVETRLPQHRRRVKVKTADGDELYVYLGLNDVWAPWNGDAHKAKRATHWWETEKEHSTPIPCL